MNLKWISTVRCCCGLTCAVFVAADLRAASSLDTSTPWQVGRPIVTYWAGPPMTDATALQMAEGGWNLVWCSERELDVAARHGLRAQLQDGLITPGSLDDPALRGKLEALVERVRSHPALYSYFLTDEPNVTNYAGLGRLVGFLRERDPAHLAYINLFPTYANNEQLGCGGDTVTAYRDYLNQFLATVRPALLSYDHYQFSVKGDNPDYFLNLALIRRAALDAGIPFLNIVQACTWAPSMRVPGPDEMRYLVYTTLAYGAQGISYYVYSCAGHTGMIANADGTPTVLYDALRTLNRDFASIAAQLQPARSLGVYHAGMFPPGAVPLPADAAFQLDPPLALEEYRSPQPARGVLVGLFGPAGTQGPRQATHAVVVNLDYHADREVGVSGPAPLELFDPAAVRWSQAAGAHLSLRLGHGQGQLIRLKP